MCVWKNNKLSSKFVIITIYDTLAPTVTALHTILEVCHAYAGPHDIVYNTTKTVCNAGPARAITGGGGGGSQQESGSEMRNLASSRNFVT